MKKQLSKWVVIVLLFAPILLTNCSEEEEDAVLRENSFVFDNKVYDTQKGALVNFGLSNSTSSNADYCLHLYNSSLVFTDAGKDDGVNPFTGTGSKVLIYLQATPNVLETTGGIFNYIPRGDNSGVRYVLLAEVDKFNSSTDYSTHKVQISKAGDIYTITYSGTLENKSFEGKYKGPLTYHNE